MEILNGNGDAGCAEQTAAELQRLGVQVTRMTNAANFDYTKSQLVIWSANNTNMRTLQAYMGLKRKNIKTKSNKKRIDATLVLGSDWEQIVKHLKSKKE
jgi:hypothetical protein